MFMGFLVLAVRLFRKVVYVNVKCFGDAVVLKISRSCWSKNKTTSRYSYECARHVLVNIDLILI
jgi:hypothetical protein